MSRWDRAPKPRVHAAARLGNIDSAAATSHLAFVEEISPALSGPAGKEFVERLDARYDEVLAALAWFIEAGRSDEALRLANGLYRFWISTRRFEDGTLWFDRVLESGEGDDKLRGRAFLWAGFMPFWLGDDERAAALFDRALAMGRELDDPQLISQALGGLARVALRTDVAQGRRIAREALEVSEAAGDESARSNALHLLGVGAQIAGDLVEARDWMSRRLALVREIGNQFLIASEASNLSMVERQLGNLTAAEALAREALEISERTGDEFTKPFAISGLAALAMERRDHERAAVLLGAAEALMEARRMAWPPDERPHYERMLSQLPEAMAAGEFERAREVGRSMPPPEAVAFALGRPR
jgi:tetratricopeptide (TPR) repeat protein